MVGRILKLFHREHNNLHEAAYLLASFALLSQVLALVRDRFLAHDFGAGQTLDIYYAAFRIPDLIYVSVASFVAVTVLIPFLIQKVDKSKEEALLFLDAVFSVFLIAIIVVCIIAFFLMPYLSHIVAPGFGAKSTETFVFVSRALLLSPILLGLSNLLGSVTQLYKKFFVFALSPVLYNLGIIFGLVFLEPSFGLIGVVYGVIIGAFCHMAIQLPVVMQSGLLPRGKFLFGLFRNKAVWREIKQLVKVSFPRTISLSITQIVLLVLISVASLLSAGAISVFSLSNNLQSVPLAIIGMSYSVAAFPMLATFYARGKHDQFKNQIVSATKHILFWSLPAAALFIVLRAQVVRVIYGSGQFTWADTRLTAAALALFALSVAAQSLVLLYARGYYAAGNTRRPLSVNIVSAAIIVALSIALVPTYHHFPEFKHFFDALLRVEGIEGTAILMLPLSFSIGMIFNACVLIYFFRKDFHLKLMPVRRSFLHGLSGAVFLGFVTYIFLNIFDNIFNLNTYVGIFLQGFCAGIVGIIAAVLFLYFIGNDEIRVVGKTLRRKFWRTPTVAENVDEM